MLSYVTGRNRDFLIDSRPLLFFTGGNATREDIFAATQIGDPSCLSESVSERRWTEC